jgi:hypothetical protein
MASAGLDDEVRRGEQCGELGHHPRGPLQVDASTEDQHRRIEPGERGSGTGRVKGSLGAEDLSRLLICL